MVDRMENQINKSSYLNDVFKRFLSHRLAMIGAIILFIEIMCVLLLPPLLKLDPYSMDYANFGGAPSAQHLLGCDDVGRDLFARIVYGGRVSLMVGICSAIVSLLIGVPLGLIAGYFRGWIETVIMRCADIFMSFPSMILILVLASVLGQSVITVTLVIGFLGWTEFARLIYASVLSVREKDYIESAKAIGTKNGEILWRYVLPNSFAPVIISFTFRTAQAIITESSLSFLGLGVQPPEASWGNILYYAQSISVLSTKLYMWVPAGVLLVLTVLSINFVGDGIRDALDTRMKL
jgi:peptide/nickel transport system permease protein